MAEFEKAFFTNEAGDAFYVQFNPKEIKLDESAAWKASDEHEADKPALTYEKGNPSTMSMELIFDTTADEQVNVNDTWIKTLRSFFVVEKGGEDGETKRPQYCTFNWGTESEGGIKFDCVMEKIAVTYLMFKPDGTPIRARAQITLKERQRPELSGSAVEGVNLQAYGKTVPTEGITTHVVRSGQTVQDIAFEYGTEPELIYEANGFEQEFEPGEEIVVVSSKAQAEAYAQYARAEVNPRTALETEFNYGPEDLFLSGPYVGPPEALPFNPEAYAISQKAEPLAYAFAGTGRPNEQYGYWEGLAGGFAGAGTEDAIPERLFADNPGPRQGIPYTFAGTGEPNEQSLWPRKNVEYTFAGLTYNPRFGAPDDEEEEEEEEAAAEEGGGEESGAEDTSAEETEADTLSTDKGEAAAEEDEEWSKEV